LTSEEERLFNRVKTVNPDAYDRFLHGLEHLHRFTREDNALARDYFLEAIVLDPDYARAHTNLALTHSRDVVWGWTDQREEPIRLALQYIDRADRLDPTDSRMYFARTSLSISQRHYDRALVEARRAIELEPNYADGYGTLAFVLFNMGELEEALPAIHTANRLNPRYPFVYSWIEGHIYFLMKEYEKAVPFFREVLEQNPAFASGRLTLIASYGHLGMEDDAEWEIDELLTVRPEYSLSVAREESTYKRPQDLETFVEGLRRAGIPE
jgi:adenylate cyclase